MVSVRPLAALLASFALFGGVSTPLEAHARKPRAHVAPSASSAKPVAHATGSPAPASPAPAPASPAPASPKAAAPKPAPKAATKPATASSAKKGKAAKPKATAAGPTQPASLPPKPGKSAKPAKSAKPGKAAKKPAPPSESVGAPNEGSLSNGVALDVSLPSIRVVPFYEKSGARYGLSQLTHAIERGAKAVAKRYPGSVLDVGDLSRREGGDIARHNSHESGRDADVAFYAVDAKGKPVHGKEFVRFDDKGHATNLAGARFDAARTWLFVQSLVTDPGASVSHILVASHLRDLLLAEARRVGVSLAVLNRAQRVLLQPTEASAHDDHMHLRIKCPRRQARCVELSEGAPLAGGKARYVNGKVVTTKRGKAKGALKTPPKATAKAPNKPKSPPRTASSTPQAPQAPQPVKWTKKTRGVVVTKPASKPAGATIVPFLRELLDRGADADADADGTEVRDLVDDGGMVRITN